MSGKTSKYFRKKLRQDYGDLIEMMAEENSRIIKPKPRFIPTFLWIWMAGFFIRIKR